MHTYSMRITFQISAGEPQTLTFTVQAYDTTTAIAIVASKTQAFMAGTNMKLNDVLCLGAVN